MCIAKEREDVPVNFGVSSPEKHTNCIVLPVVLIFLTIVAILVLVALLRWLLAMQASLCSSLNPPPCHLCLACPVWFETNCRQDCASLTLAVNVQC